MMAVGGTPTFFFFCSCFFFSVLGVVDHPWGVRMLLGLGLVLFFKFHKQCLAAPFSCVEQNPDQSTTGFPLTQAFAAHGRIEDLAGEALTLGFTRSRYKCAVQKFSYLVLPLPVSHLGVQAVLAPVPCRYSACARRLRPSLLLLWARQGCAVILHRR
ncbi:hypothetical protein J3F84DRAFT_362289 [Trichoderma pleuroticola]